MAERMKNSQAALQEEAAALKEEAMALHQEVASLERKLESTEKQRRDVLVRLADAVKGHFLPQRKAQTSALDCHWSRSSNLV